MKDVTTVLAYFVANLASLACVVAAGFLALHGIPGWGWFLFVGILLCASVKSKPESEQ